ncbi:hypothetical protein ROBYS_36230 [Roseobacter sp. OBYS 0001]|nr:hypothetical protein ROBYS_36230 [Roseobacter sp. OBYS 0001]
MSVPLMRIASTTDAAKGSTGLACSAQSRLDRVTFATISCAFASAPLPVVIRATRDLAGLSGVEM